MSNITLYDYLAYNVPADCENILMQYDIPAATSEQELVENLKAYVRIYGENALKSLAEIHPDKDLISEMAAHARPYEGKSESEYLNATGAIDIITSIEQTLMNGTGGAQNTNEGSALSKTDLLLGIGVAILSAQLFKK